MKPTQQKSRISTIWVLGGGGSLLLMYSTHCASNFYTFAAPIGYGSPATVNMRGE